MSHFTKMKGEILTKNEKELVASLQECYGKDGVEVHETSQELMTYFGEAASKQKDKHLQAPPCEIIVRKDTLSKKLGYSVASNDLGYKRGEDGKFVVYGDAAGFPQQHQDEVLQNYNVRVSERELRAKGYNIKKVKQDDGSVRIIASTYS